MESEVDEEQNSVILNEGEKKHREEYLRQLSA